MIFIGTGAFQELFDKENTSIGFTSSKENTKAEEIDTAKLIKYGLKRELIGRLPILVQLNSLGKQELKEIILYSNESELLANIDALQTLGIAIENLDEVIDFIVDDAINRKVGARGLVLTINNLFEQIFYEVGNNPGKYSKVIFGSNIIKDNKDFTLIEKRNYTKKKKLAAN